MSSKYLRVGGIDDNEDLRDGDSEGDVGRGGVGDYNSMLINVSCVV
jgi:hypothetical protein